MRLSLAILFPFVTIVASQRYVRCGTPKPVQSLLDQLDVTSANTRVNPNVATYVHVVTTQAKQGLYSQAQINEQIRVMNSDYSSTGISFTLKGTDFTVNDAWATSSDGSAAETAMKQALRKGTYSTLNLYFLSDLGDGLLGFCYFPVPNPTANDRTLDGCVNLADSLPGGSAAPYNLGKTASHEAGHWFGLYHVFQTTLPVSIPQVPCAAVGAGDYVSDTPAQITPTSGCPASKDSCPRLPGLDSIHNYMDYSDDICLNQFTPGQGSRARAIFQALRAGK
ncbi:uncharacterized protein MYCFIDRAFT_38651 [Pseudocercospora fijiensis CIRAD86]|uniref:Peptidase M43 pregnancy-associated plasma-A domain-containing protein n=1 Tax=Pseudocercospora fijiensis (strain CIRAD86) TaxID=383855 RepID=M2ZQI6_PSEFD|nr:uncharacterized protein MYCFIDRAFT_38651 [Pseudocercospora fijiensis CIRAD86]EME81334.1 hypothetical protein MYCFIDRAFT_38651 [Pseudocercospora fijiensis CIRAD86]